MLCNAVVLEIEALKRLFSFLKLVVLANLLEYHIFKLLVFLSKSGLPYNFFKVVQLVDCKTSLSDKILFFHSHLFCLFKFKFCSKIFISVFLCKKLRLLKNSGFTKIVVFL